MRAVLIILFVFGLHQIVWSQEELIILQNESIEFEADGFYIEKVEDVSEIVSRGVMMTPAVVVDGQIKIVGHVPSVEEVKKLLERFKYYMSDQYREDWKIEQEAKKYNL